MLGPIYKYRNAEHFELLIKEIKNNGIKVRKDENHHNTISIIFKRGFGEIGCHSWGEGELHFGYNNSFNPFLWYFDAKLLKKIENVFLLNGSEKVAVNDN